MNRKIIILIGILFCGSFGVMVASEASVALFKEVNDWYLENGELINQTIVPVALTAEGKKIYDDLIAKYRNKTLTVADNTQKNLSVLDYQRRILLFNYSQRTYGHWKTMVGWNEEVWAYILPFIGVGSAIASDYVGRGLHGLLKGAANIDLFSQQKTTTLQSIGDFVGAHKSIVPKTLLAATALLEMNLLSAPIVGPVHNKIVDKYNEWLFWWSYKKEIALIDEVMHALVHLH